MQCHARKRGNSQKWRGKKQWQILGRVLKSHLIKPTLHLPSCLPWLHICSGYEIGEREKWEWGGVKKVEGCAKDADKKRKSKGDKGNRWIQSPRGNQKKSGKKKSQGNELITDPSLITSPQTVPLQWNKGFPVSAPRLLEPMTSLLSTSSPVSDWKIGLTGGSHPSAGSREESRNMHLQPAQMKTAYDPISLKNVLPLHGQAQHLSPGSVDLSTAVKWGTVLRGIKYSTYLFFILFFCGLVLSPLSPCSLLLSSVVGGKKTLLF